MEIVFFYIMPSNRGLSVPIQTMCTSNSSLSLRNFCPCALVWSGLLPCLLWGHG